jgi:hypothetical protein
MVDEPRVAGTGQSEPVGMVLGTEDATPLQWHVALHEGDYLQLDDVVTTRREVPGVGEVLLAGVVTEVQARHEGASFGSDVFLISDGVLPARIQETAEITTTRVEPECYVPPLPGEPAHAGAVRHAIESSGWLGTRFDVYRSRVEYPVLFTMFSARVEIAKR